MKPTLILFYVFIALAGAVSAKPKYPPEMPDAREVVYKTASETDLKLWIFEPTGHKTSDKRPAVVFFFGGGWRSGFLQRRNRQRPARQQQQHASSPALGGSPGATY